MNTTRAALSILPRPVRAVPLPGGGSVHVRHVSLAELNRIDKRAEEVPEGTDRNIRRAVLLCVFALAEPDGTAAFSDVTDGDLEFVESLTPSQIEAISTAAVPSKADAKNA